jgi:hypothetical protein
VGFEARPIGHLGVKGRQMVDDNQHIACVNRWCVQADASSAEGLLRDFEQAFAVIWRRALLTLGDVTLMAIVNRVLHNAAERSPMLSALTVHESGIRCQRLRERSTGLRREELEQSLRLVLIYFLSILGTLTADVLTPALHAELSKHARARAARAAEKPALARSRERTRQRPPGA